MALFTYSYFHSNGAEFNPLADYVESFAVCRSDMEVHRTSPTEDRKQLARQGYVFANWLNVAGSVMLMVKPSAQVASRGRITALQLNATGSKGVYCVVVTIETQPDFSHQQIAGLVSASEFEAVQLCMVNADHWISVHERRLKVCDPRYVASHRSAVDCMERLKVGARLNEFLRG